MTKAKAFFHSSVLNNNHNVLSWGQSSGVLVANHSGFWNRKRNQISKFRFILIPSFDLTWGLLFAGIVCISYFPGVTCSCASCQCKCPVCSFFLTELKQLISSQYTLQLKMQLTLFYAVAKQSLKKTQANNVSITVMIFFAFFPSFCASNNKSHKFILSV